MKMKSFRIPNYVYFVLVILIVVILFPREGRFRYSFNQGKPWKYGLLTAPFDFPVYKTTSELEKERDSLLLGFRPYFREDDEIAASQIARFRSDYGNLWDESIVEYVSYQLQQLYRSGIISVNDYNLLQDNHYNSFMVIEDNVAVNHPVTNVYTMKSAYAFILTNCPPHLDVSLLRSGDLNNYLVENFKYDDQTSENVKKELLQKISPTKEMVQAGEKIVDRGEIINSETYNILSSMKQISETRTGNVQQQSGLFFGIIILTVCLIICYLLYLSYFRVNIYQQRKHVIFMLCLITLFTVLTEFCVQQKLFNVYIIPFAIIPIVIRTFFDSRTAQATHGITVLLCSLMVPFPFEFVLLQFMTCMVVIFVLKDLTKRAQLIQCSFYVLVIYIVVYVALVMIQEGDWAKINWKMFIYFGINVIFLMFTYILIYIIEKLFGYLSNVTLVELSDINSQILRDLSETCPGTFQHSLQVSILGTAAASKIGANPQLIRTGALYHDIGKMVNPAYFTENQGGTNNPHDHLSFDRSAQIIINHVHEGVKIANKNNLPTKIIDFIRTHHGKGKAKYFYNSFVNQFPDIPVDESLFTYPGPNPQTKETAILMMADSVEAASRSLSEYTEASITALVNKIIDAQIQDGLLSEAPLTFQDISKVKSIFVEKLLTMYHSRISYPEKINRDSAVS